MFESNKCPTYNTLTPQITSDTHEYNPAYNIKFPKDTSNSEFVIAQIKLKQNVNDLPIKIILHEGIRHFKLMIVHDDYPNFKINLDTFSNTEIVEADERTTVSIINLLYFYSYVRDNGTCSACTLDFEYCNTNTDGTRNFIITNISALDFK